MPEQTQDEDDYSDLVPGALVHHPKYGTGRILPEPWQFGQPLVAFDGRGRIACNPARLSTDDQD